MPLQPTNNFESLSIWLNENLNDHNSFTPHVDAIPKVKSKGIYFWFMHRDGYKQLSNFVEITPVAPVFKRTIDGIEYDLVYLGTAGTGKKGNSNLEERFAWHIKQNHSNSNVCHGTLSTLRAGLGALLSTDLILPNTENIVNEFMAKFMKLYWIEYPNDNALIDNDEKLLIVGIKPLLNLKKNPSEKKTAIINPTKNYKIRRNRILGDTKKRLGFDNRISNKAKEIKLKPNNFGIEVGDCVEFNVTRHQNIAQVAIQHTNLPRGLCTIQLFSKMPNDKRKFVNGKIRTIRTVGRTVADFFNAPDGNTQKWMIIRDEMNLVNNEVEEITVRVCKIN